MASAHTCKRQPDDLTVEYAGGTVWQLCDADGYAAGRVLCEVEWCPFCGLKLTGISERHVIHLRLEGKGYYCGGLVGKWSGSGTANKDDITCKACVKRLERDRIRALQSTRRDIMPVTGEAQPEGSPCA